MAKCTWKPPEDEEFPERYLACQHDCYKDYDFCIFHMPLEAKRQSPEMVKDFKESFDEFFEENALLDESGDFLGFIFPDGTDLGRRDFRRSFEREDLLDERPEWCPPVDFSRVTFGNDVIFDYSKFGENTLFNNVCFSGSANFSNASFGDYTHFTDTDFSGLADFDKATFGRGISFLSVMFLESSDFNSVVFGDNCSFTDTIFSDNTTFIDVNFGENNKFAAVCFGLYNIFYDTEFGEHFMIYDSVFGGSVSFTDTNFGDDALFYKITFSGFSDFSKINGYSNSLNANIDQSVFNESLDPVRFRGKFISKVPPKLHFQEIAFRCGANFRANDLSRVSFQQVDLSKLTFINSQISNTKFVSCDWGSGPESNKYAIREKPRRWSFNRPRLLFDELICRDQRIEARYKDKTNYKNYDPKIRQFRKDNSLDIQPSDIEVLALQLKQSLEATKDPIAAGDFHFAVMEMKRMQAMESKRWGRAFMLWLYKTINGYGERYGRTALWLAMLIGIFSFIYFQMNGLDATVDIKNVANINQHVPDLGFWKQVWFSIAFAFQNVLPFKLYSDYLCAVGPNLHWVRGLAMGETLVGTTLFTFFALALRRRFKR